MVGIIRSVLSCKILGTMWPLGVDFLDDKISCITSALEILGK